MEVDTLFSQRSFVVQVGKEGLCPDAYADWIAVVTVVL